MKQTRKVLALVLALTLILGMATTVFAAPGHKHTITINNDRADYDYTAYQIFSGTLGADGVLSNIEWGDGVNSEGLLAELNTIPAYATCENAKQVAGILAQNSAMDDPDAVAFAEIVAKYVVAAKGHDAEYKTTHYEIKDLDDGYYIVINDVVPSTGATNVVTSRYVLEVVRDIEVAHKGEFPTVDKKIVENGEKVNINEKSIGDVVKYDITGTLPADLAYYDTYYYLFTDKLSKGLTYNGDATVSIINGTDVVDATAYFYISASAYDAVNGTTIKIGVLDLLALELVADLDPNTDGNQTASITATTKIVVNYTATLNENAVIAVEGNPNVVDLTYSRDPNNDGDGATNPPPPPPGPEIPEPEVPVGKTPEKKVETWTTQLTIQKVDGAGNILTGAEFTLTGTMVKTVLVTGAEYQAVAAGTGTHYKLKDGTYTETAPIYDNPDTTNVNEDTTDLYETLTKDYNLVKIDEVVETTEDVTATGFVDAEGKLTFAGLGAGTYTLTETVTPHGFNTIDPITFTIVFDKDSAGHKFTSSNGWILNDSEIANALYAKIVNVAGTTLPSTGGIGTTLFYIFGGLMFAGAAVLLVTKKRMAA